MGKRSTELSSEEQTVLDETMQNYISRRCPNNLLRQPITNLSHNSLSSKMTSTSKSREGGHLVISNLDKDDINDVQMEVVFPQERLCEVNTTNVSVNESNIDRTKDEITTLSSSTSETSQEQWAQGFQRRCKVEAVRNCSRLNWDIKEKIVNDIAFAILRLGGVSLENEDDEEIKVKGQKLWRRGGKKTALFEVPK